MNEATKAGTFITPRHGFRLSDNDRKMLESWYESISKQSDEEVFLAASLIVQLAVRPSILKKITKDYFEEQDGSPYKHIVYSFNQRLVRWPISDNLWRLIQRVSGERLKKGMTLFPHPTVVLHRLQHSLCTHCDFRDQKEAIEKLWLYPIEKILRMPKGLELAVNISGESPLYFDIKYPW